MRSLWSFPVSDNGWLVVEDTLMTARAGPIAMASFSLLKFDTTSVIKGHVK